MEYKKRIILLGGSTQQIPAIQYAVSQKYYTILCDFLPNNPGQNYADKYYCVSTTDKDAILRIARQEKIDAIVAYASDPAAPTAAYVAEALGLPSNSYSSVEILSYKDKFREFLANHDFATPKAKAFNNIDEVDIGLNMFKYPLMVKPIDSSGSKGVNLCHDSKDLEKYFLLAKEYSRSGRVILEEYIEKDHPYMIAGDCFVNDGKVIYWGFLNSHRSLHINPFVPIGTSHPLMLDEERINLVKMTIQRLFDELDIRIGAFNLEVMIDSCNRVYLIEVGPRNGGNMIPDLLFEISGFNMIQATIESALGNRIICESGPNHSKNICAFVLHSPIRGRLNGVSYDIGLKAKIIRSVMYKQIGDEIESFDGANKALGIVLIDFDDSETMFDFLDNPYLYIKIY